MEREVLVASKRDTLGKKVRFLRRQGLTPANVYGRSTESIPLEIETPVLERTISRVGRNALVSLRIGQQARTVMLRDIDRDPLTDELLHVGFFEVEMTQRVKTDVPIVFVGEAPAEKSSRLMLIHNLSVLHIEALPGDLPRNIEVDVSPLAEAGQTIHVGDIVVGEGVDVLTDDDEVVVHVMETRVAEVEEAAEKKEAVEAEAPAEGDAGRE